MTEIQSYTVENKLISFSC